MGFIKQKLLSFAAFIGLVFVIGGAGSLVTMPSVASWYPHLVKPGWNPPDWLFGPVWTVLYGMIAVAGWRVWNRLPVNSFRARILHEVMVPYWIQLVLNFLWSFIFFGFKKPLNASGDIVLLIAAIGVSVFKFYPVDKAAAYLLIPYLLWILYAASLNIAIVVLN